MAYQTGTSTGPNDLIDKLRTFLEGDGWTTNLFTTVGSGYRLHVQKTASDSTVMYFNFRSAIAEHGTTITGDNRTYLNDGYYYGDVTGLLVNGSTGYNVANVWDEQPGYPYSQDVVGDGLNSMAMCMTEMSISAIPAYYFFTIDDTVNIVVETTSGIFQFMSFGLLEKQGVYTGGQFFSASYNSYAPKREYTYIYAQNVPHYFAYLHNGDGSNGAVYVDMDSVSDFRISKSETNPEIRFPCVVSTRGNESSSQSGLGAFFWSKSPNFYNNISSMMPIYVMGKRSDSNYSLLGWPSGVRFLNVLNYSAGQEITYGTETWKVFPEKSFSNYDTYAKNKNCGFAFKKVV